MLPFRPRRAVALFALALSLAATAAAQSGATASASSEKFQALQQAASAALEAGNADEAIRDYKRLVTLRPGWAQGWWDLGATEYQTDHYADAVQSLRKLTALAPDAKQAWDLLGLSQFETKDYPGARTSLEKAHGLNGSEDPEIAHVAAYHLALLLVRAGSFDRAASVIHSAFGQHPPAQARTALGLALLRVPLLPSEIDPSKDALVQAAGKAASSPDAPRALVALIAQYPKIPWLHYAYGLALAQAGQTREAMAQQKLEAGLSPASPLPWIEISGLALREKQPQQALKAARRAVSLNAKSPAARSALANALTANGSAKPAQLDARKATSLSEAPQRDPRMIALYAGRVAAPADGSATWTRAMRNYSEGHYPEAIAALKSWVEQNPNDGTAWAVMGLSEFALKDYGNARIHLQRGVNLGLKGSAEATQLASNRLALLLIRGGQFDAATSLLKQFAGKPPLAAETRLALGLALLRMPVLPSSLNPRQRDLAGSAGAIVELLLGSHYSQAFPAFQKLIAENPSTPWLHYAYGVALDSLSRYDDAKTRMRKETRLSPHSALPWIHIASIAARQHLPAEALKAARTAVGLAPDSAEAHYQLGRAWLENKDAPKAIAELKKANALKPNAPEIHFTLARAYAKAGQPSKAAAERAAFLRLKAIAAHHAQGGAPGQSVLKADSN